MPDFLKDLLPGLYSKSPRMVVVGVFVIYNIVALLTCFWLKNASLEKQPIISNPTHIEINGSSVNSGDCSASAIGQAQGISIQCGDKGASTPAVENPSKPR